MENKGVDKSLFRHSLLQLVSAQSQDHIVNKNIEDLKQLQKTVEMFDKIYETINRIAKENDYYAMNFAVKEKFCGVKNISNQTIFERSIKECDFQLARFIVEFGGNSNYNDIIPKESDFIRYNFKTQHFDVNNSLFWASLYGYHEVVKFLLTVPGIDVNAKDKWNKTALFYASERGHHKVVKLLLTVPGIDVNAKDNSNNTALMFASSNNHHEVVKLLLTVPGIDVNAKDSCNKTALIWASFWNYHKVVKLLLSVPGIDVEARDSCNNTALHYASREGFHEVVKLFHTVPGVLYRNSSRKVTGLHVGFDT